MHGGDEDHATGVLSLTNEEPLVVMKAGVDIVWEVVREDCSNSRGSVVRKGEVPLRRGRYGSVHERALGAENGDIGRDWGSGVHRGSEVFASRGGNENIIGIDGNVFVKRGEEESVKDFLGYLRGSGRHGRQGRTVGITGFITLVVRVFFGACLGDFRRSLRLGLERTSLTPTPKSLLMGETPSIVQGTGGFDVFHGSEI
jgi:hypothetical protein